MKSFRSYLFESMFQRNGKQDDDDDENSWHVYDHEARVGDDHVNIKFSNYPVGFGHHYDVTFHVNHETSFNRAKPKNPMKVLSHVQSVVRKFIQEKKPVTLSFSARDANIHKEEGKQNLYAKFAEQLARKHPESEVQSDEGRSSEVTFYGNRKYWQAQRRLKDPK